MPVRIYSKIFEQEAVGETTKFDYLEVYFCSNFYLYNGFVIVILTITVDLGTNIVINKCAHIGRSCGIRRDKVQNPTRVSMTPCCEHLVCAGLGPNEIKNNAGGAHHSDDLLSVGMCSLNLDNGAAAKDKAKYEAYVKGLPNN